MNGIPAEGWKACGGAGLATARCPGSLASGGTADQTRARPHCARRGTHGAWPQTQTPAEGPPGGLLKEDVSLEGVEPGRRMQKTVDLEPKPNPSDGQAWVTSRVALPNLWPQFPHLRAGGGPGQHLVVSGARGACAWAGQFGRRPWFPARR